jgi:diguanylate cyclase (GGDEF)-like protein/PAS domain S-box-containing protein
MVAGGRPAAGVASGAASCGLSQRAYEALTQGIVVLADDGRIVQSNPAAWRILGFTSDQITGRTPMDAGWHTIHEDGSEFLGESHPGTVALATGEPVLGVTMGVRRRDEKVTWIWINAVPLASSVDPDDGAVVVTFTDVSSQFCVMEELRSARAELAESEERYRLLAENSSDVVFHIEDGIVQWVSPSITHALGWTPEEWVGQEGRSFLHPDDAAALGATREALLAGRSVITRRRVRAKDGRYHWVESNAKVFLDADGHHRGVLTSFRVADEQVEIEHQLVHAAEHDALTGLLTGAALLRRLEPRRIPAQGGRAAVLFCDIDDFKATNDEFGHAVGDEVLRMVAARVGGALRGADLVARFGGDEIVALLVNVADPAEAERLADRVRQATSEPIVVDGTTVPVTTSIGVTLARTGEHVEQVIARADRAMYEAKGHGKNRVVSL